MCVQWCQIRRSPYNQTAGSEYFDGHYRDGCLNLTWFLRGNTPALMTRRSQSVFPTPSGVITGMKIFRGSTFKADRPWGAEDIANMGGITTRLHWTDEPYKWHVNDGEEVFAVLNGRVEMRYRLSGVEHSTILETGDVFYASIGTEHVAHPVGEARVLVIEREGSV